MHITILEADFRNPVHAEALVALLDLYARDPMGGGRPLPPQVCAELPEALRRIPGAFSLLAFDAETPAGLVNCFLGFSTFACKPVLNVHDVVVAPTYRRKGVGRLLFAQLDRKARALGCCKLTLEVIEGNQPALELYRACGFVPYELHPAKGRALYWQKLLTEADGA